MDEAIAWYDSQRADFGIEFASEIETFLTRIAGTPEQFSNVRRRKTRSLTPIPLHDSFPDRIEPDRCAGLSSTQSAIPKDWKTGNRCAV